MILGFEGCSVLKTRENINISEENITNTDEIKKFNITSLSFSFQKIEISVEGSGKEQKFMGNLKYMNSGKFLISLRNNSGMEGVRIYIDKDTILANDRINRKTYYGSSSHLFEKYGITAEYFPVLLGDLIIDEKAKNNTIKCNNGTAEINELIGQNEIHYIADCSQKKIIKAELSKDPDKEAVNVEFRNFRKIDNHFYPLNIRINDPYNKNKITIEIKKAEIYNGQELKFIPGNNYELILLQ